MYKTTPHTKCKKLHPTQKVQNYTQHKVYITTLNTKCTNYTPHKVCNTTHHTKCARLHPTQSVQNYTPHKVYKTTPHTKCTKLHPTQSVQNYTPHKVCKTTPHTKCTKLHPHNRNPQRIYRPRISSRQLRYFRKSIPEFGETNSSVLGCDRISVKASIKIRSRFDSFPVYVYKFLRHYLNNMIFDRQ